jgi:D-amino-acid dehydrogenase
MKTVVLGGGIIGVTTAYFLAKAGEEVAVIERQPGVALETSFANAGLVSPGHSYTWASPQAPKILLKSLFSDGQSLRLRLIPDWRMYAWCWEFLKNCTAERARLNTSRKVRLSRYSQGQLKAVTEQENLAYDRISKGLLYLHRDQAALDRAVANMSVLLENGLALRTLNRAETLAQEPALAASGDTLAGSIFCPTDESGDAHLFTKALYERCLALGVKFEFNTTIQNVSASADVVDYIETSRGRTTADRFVLAMGCYSPAVARKLGYRLPVYPVKGYSVTLPVLDGHHAPDIGGVDENNLVAWARLGNRLRFTATAEFAGFDTGHQPGDFTHTLRTARDLFPNGADYSQPTYWAGLRPMTPNGTPVVGKTRHRNLFFNTGHGHLGWTWSCGTARLIADIIQDRKPEIDLTGLTLASNGDP